MQDGLIVKDKNDDGIMKSLFLGAFEVKRFLREKRKLSLWYLMYYPCTTFVIILRSLVSELLENIAEEPKHDDQITLKL